MALANKLQKGGRVSFNSVEQFFTVRSDTQTNVVEYRQAGWICTCKPTRNCAHILAVLYSLRMKGSLKKTPNAERLLKKNRYKSDGTRGRKKPNTRDEDGSSRKLQERNDRDLDSMWTEDDITDFQDSFEDIV